MFCKCVFPHFQNLKAGEIPQPDFPDDYNLGDIFLGVEFILQQCKEDEDYYDILTETATHGLCHLLGFTHSTEAEWQKVGALPCLQHTRARIAAQAPETRLCDLSFKRTNHGGVMYCMKTTVNNTVLHI